MTVSPFRKEIQTASDNRFLIGKGVVCKCNLTVFGCRIACKNHITVDPVNGGVLEYSIDVIDRFVNEKRHF